MWLKKIFEALSRDERKTAASAVALLIVSATTLLTIGFNQVTRAIPASGGDFSNGTVGQPVYVNPVTAASAVDRDLVRLIFSKLGDITDKMSVSANGKTWDIRLKEKLLWQDGDKLTSDDVIFTIRKIQDPESGSPFSGAWQGVGTQRVSELEFQLVLNNVYSFFPDTVENLYILPKHLFADTPPANWRLSDYNLKPVGSGPYKFLSSDKRSDGFVYSYRLQSWDGYPGDKSLIQKINFQFFGKTDQLVDAFNSGQVDGASGLEPADLIRIKRTYEAIPFRLPSYYAVFLNQSNSVPLKDKSVRIALGHAIDRENLINEVLGGRGKPAAGPVPDGAPYFNQEIEMATTSLDFASTTLDGAGWKMSDNGVRQKTVQSAAIPLEFKLSVPQVDFLLKTADSLKKSWEKIGVKISIEPQSTEQIAGETIKNRNYEMLLFGNTLGGNSDLFSFWHSSQRFYPFLNLSLYSNKKADSLIESIRQHTATSSLSPQFDQLESAIVNDYPAVFLYSPDYLYVASKNLHGVDGGFVPEPADIFASANKWYLNTARVLK